MRTIVAVALLITAGRAGAEDGACRIESHRFWQMPDEPVVVIEGAASCESGTAVLRVYDGRGRYLGNAHGGIEGYALSAVMVGEAPAEMRLRYTIEPGPPPTFKNLLDPAR